MTTRGKSMPRKKVANEQVSVRWATETSTDWSYALEVGAEQHSWMDELVLRLTVFE
jgi:hypothetical protein